MVLFVKESQYEIPVADCGMCGARSGVQTFPVLSGMCGARSGVQTFPVLSGMCGVRSGVQTFPVLSGMCGARSGVQTFPVLSLSNLGKHNHLKNHVLGVDYFDLLTEVIKGSTLIC